MHRLLKPKNIHRLALALVLLAPLAYLFGTQIATLAGAHGEELLADTTEVTPSYEELMNAENFSYGAFDWENEHGTRYGFSLGWLSSSVNGTAEFNYYLGCSRTGVSVTNYGFDSSPDEFENNGLGFVGSYSDGVGLDVYDYWGYWSIDYDADTSSAYVCGYVVSDSYIFAFVTSHVNSTNSIDFYSYQFNDGTWFQYADHDNSFSDNMTSYYMYFDDGSHLPEGIEWNDELRSYFVPTVKPVESTSYRNALFGNMFGKSNFLTRWGENALSENPVGFAPFGSLFRFVDQNMLHLSNEQIGLMGYGYMYYAVHVLLFDVLVLALAFVATLPQRILNMVNDRGGID